MNSLPLTTLFAPALAGFALGGSLIVAIGAQNAFVLRMGLLRQYVFVLCLICALSDAVLIGVGVAGLGSFIDANPALLNIISLGGGIFLLVYALMALMRVFNAQAMLPAQQASITLTKAISICLAFTFLNPHVYLDTVVLVGSLAAAWHGSERLVFTLGAICASFVWFFSLGYGARLLEPIFRQPIAWRVLDAVIFIVMTLLGASLLHRIIN